MRAPQRPRGINISPADRDVIEAATPGWHWSGGCRAPEHIRRRGEGNNIIGWKVISMGRMTEVTVRETNGAQLIKTLASYMVPSTDLPALAQNLREQYQ